MSSRPLLSPFSSIKNGNMSGNITGLPTIIDNLSMVSYAFSWSGATPVGTISIQVSNDYSQNPDGSVRNPGTWNNLPLSYNGSSTTTIPVTGNTGNGFIDVDATAGYAIRPIYTAGSGTGTLQAIIAAKVT